ncbi:MAG: hypothetical protein A2293_08950 [Elusimicrobia bacterium RIFOXYB2_FULL_49_7]|nr:MAG: hypothetical protein A2293_08950 [Elusimicrobia bacterium RIFOXYB2_FULL_49_7]
MSFNFITSPLSHASYNMAVDEFLFREKSGLFLRIYGWSPPAISLGFGQQAAQEIDVARTQAAGVSVVRRLTGGRAVLHDQEITYSIAGETGGLFGPDLNSTYLKISEGLVATLKRLGVTAEVEKGGASDRREKGSASLPCFSSVSRFELLVQGRKIIGSAQRRDKNRFLQHGSLPLLPGLDLANLLNLNEPARQKYRDELKREAICLQEAGVCPSFDEAVAAFRSGFSEVFGFPVELYHFSPEEEARIGLLAAKYDSPAWNR